MKSLDDRIVMNVDMSNQSGNLIFDTHIQNYNCYFGICWYLKYNFVKFMNVHFSALFVNLNWRMEWETTRKDIN